MNGDPNDAQLQQKIKEQDNEIIVLKAALANVVRRLEVLESERSKQNGHMFPNGGEDRILQSYSQWALSVLIFRVDTKSGAISVLKDWFMKSTESSYLML